MPDSLPLGEAGVDDAQIIGHRVLPDAHAAVEDPGHFPAAGAGQAIPEEILRGMGLEEEHVIIKIDEVLRQAGDPVDVHFNGMGAEGGQVLRRDEFIVAHHMELGSLQIQKGGHMAPGDEMDLPHPGSKFFNGTEPVGQDAPVPVAVGGVAVRRRRGQIFPLLGKPGRIGTIHPQDHNINVHRHTSHIKNMAASGGSIVQPYFSYFLSLLRKTLAIFQKSNSRHRMSIASNRSELA